MPPARPLGADLEIGAQVWKPAPPADAVG